MTDPVTLTLPFLTHQGLGVLLATLGLAGASLLIWLMLGGEGRNRQSGLDRWLAALGWMLGAAWLWLLAGTLWGLWQVFNGDTDGPLSTGSLGLGALIAAFLGAPFVIYGTWLKHRTNRLEQEGHMTDRITKAVEQLGAEKTIKEPGEDGNTVERTVPNIEVRIGAILSLERIAQDSTTHDKGRDHVRVMEMLCAYIRQNSGIRSAVSRNPHSTLTSEINRLRKEGQTFLESYIAASREVSAKKTDEEGLKADWSRKILNGTRADIQMAIDVIGRRSLSQISIERPEQSNPKDYQATTVTSICNYIKSLDSPLTSEKLRSIWPIAKGVYQLDLSNVNFQGYSLKGLDFSYANMSNSAFEMANLDGANFFLANFSFSRFYETRMSQAQFSFCGFAYCQLISCWASSVKFVGNALQGCLFLGGNFSTSEFTGVSLGAAIFANVNLSRSFISAYSGGNLDIISCRLSDSLLTGVRFDQFSSLFIRDDGPIIIGKRNLADVALKNCHFDEKTVIDADFSLAFGDRSVDLPERIDRPQHWPDWVLPDDGDHAFHIEWRKWQSNPTAYTPPPKPTPAP